jgi:hypothetical protein
MWDVSLSHGWGHDDEQVQLRVANAHAGARINPVIDERERRAERNSCALGHRCRARVPSRCAEYPRLSKHL